MRVLAIDPGESTGWCYHSATEIYGFGNIAYAKINDFLAEWEKEVDIIVMEDWRTFKMKAAAKMGDRQKTSRVIGAIELFAKMKKINLVKQDSSDLPTIVKRTGIDPYKSGAHKKTHWMFAYAHGMYFLVKMKLAKSALQKEQEK